mmetsp:Transcript_22983/g.26262  ORF Transcript_22983/g.26262 Transcript_22983/m.26262 type:complete len:94 (+) Transcript_22983:35-316(+)
MVHSADLSQILFSKHGCYSDLVVLDRGNLNCRIINLAHGSQERKEAPTASPDYLPRAGWPVRRRSESSSRARVSMENVQAGGSFIAGGAGYLR